MAVINSSKFNFKDIIDDILRNGYHEEIIQATYEVVPEVAKEAAAKLRRVSPRSKGKNRGKYAKGWTYKVDRSRISVGATVYGKSGTYQLAHLLEYGHVTRNGTGRIWNTKGKTARPHIEDVEEWAMDRAYNDLMDKVRSIG